MGIEQAAVVGGIRGARLSGSRVRAAIKRGVDLALATLGLTIASVPMVLIALAIRATDGGPVVFATAGSGGRRRVRLPEVPHHGARRRRGARGASRPLAAEPAPSGRHAQAARRPARPRAPRPLPPPDQPRRAAAALERAARRDEPRRPAPDRARGAGPLCRPDRLVSRRPPGHDRSLAGGRPQRRRLCRPRPPRRAVPRGSSVRGDVSILLQTARVVLSGKGAC